MRQSIPELAIAASVFNLHCETCEDPERLAREAAERKQSAADASAYQKRMQRTFEQCPGFVGGDMPQGPGLKGRLMLEPGRVPEALAWLKRRCRVGESLDLSTDSALCVEIITRAKPSSAGTRIAVRFGRPEQFQLDL
jgi:hypothetical protein